MKNESRFIPSGTEIHSAEEEKIQFYSLKGISCAGCVRSINKAMLSMVEQSSASFSYSINFADRMLVTSGDVDGFHVISILKNAGYEASLLSSDQDKEDVEQSEKRYLKRTLIKAISALSISVLMMIFLMPSMFDLSDKISFSKVGITSAILSACVMFFSGKAIYLGAWSSIKTNSLNMDVLIALGTLSAWVYSSVVVILHTVSLYFDVELLSLYSQHLYFEAAVMILGFILLGQALESKVRGHTVKAVRSLVKLKPTTAWKKDETGEFTLVSVALLVPEDIVLIKPGEVIPADGTVIEGSGSIDESMMTGESIPVEKTLGDQVIGTTINVSGSLVCKVTKVGRNAVFSRIIEKVKQAQNSQPPLGRLADKIAAVFVPVVILIAIVTAISWIIFGPQGEWGYVLSASVAVLIIACPCALGLATPMSTMVGVGMAAKQGILIQKGDALQLASKVTTVFLDKTGTLTKGKPEVTDVLWLNDVVDQLYLSKQDILKYASMLESKSEHPLAQAIINYSDSVLEPYVAQSKDKIENFSALVNKGVSGDINNRTIRVGSLNWLANELSLNTESFAQQNMKQAKTVIAIEVSGEIVLLLAIADPLKDDSAKAIEILKKQSINVVILSGDKSESVSAIAKQLDVDNYIGELKPEEKLAILDEAQKSGEVVAMLGDGINDAPALAKADVGCAMGSGTEVAIHSADITLVRSSLMSFITAMRISKLTISNIKQNLLGAFAYNILAIPIAAGVLYPAFNVLLNPMIASIAMALSSVTVVSNAYRLKHQIARKDNFHQV